MVSISNSQSKQPPEDVAKEHISVMGKIAYGSSASSLPIRTRKSKWTNTGILTTMIILRNILTIPLYLYNNLHVNS